MRRAAYACERFPERMPGLRIAVCADLDGVGTPALLPLKPFDRFDWRFLVRIFERDWRGDQLVAAAAAVTGVVTDPRELIDAEQL